MNFDIKLINFKLYKKKYNIYEENGKIKKYNYEKYKLILEGG